MSANAPLSNQSMLRPEDPSPVSVKPGRSLKWFVISDHASETIPTQLGNLGLTEEDRLSHIGWDIGAKATAARIAQRLEATLIECGFSRLVIDCNRYPDDELAMPIESGGIIIPGNATLSKADRAARVQEIFIPYHQTIAAEIDKIEAAGGIPVILSIHSCTNQWEGKSRPWELGISWSHDARVAQPIINALNQREDLIVGDNLPYSLDIGIDFTTPEHAIRRGLAHLQIEFRQDLISDPADASRWADIFVDALLASEPNAQNIQSAQSDGTASEATIPLDNPWHRRDRGLIDLLPALTALTHPLTANHR